MTWMRKLLQLKPHSYPVFTKPSNMGSSVGISKSENQTELRTALKLAFKYDSRVLGRTKGSMCVRSKLGSLETMM